VFDSVAEDQDIESLTLFTSKGAILHARGALSSTLPVELKHATSATPFALADRIGVAVPVVALEGPRGTLVLELSTRRLSESRAQVLKHAMLAGLLAALAAAIGAFLIARTLARRLRAIATAADAVAAGDLAQNPVKEDQASDEIGVLAVAFNAMLRQLQGLIAQIRESARQEQERLETLVEARTAELAGRNADMRRLLNNVGQGFLTLDRDGRISRERSAILETWFGPVPASEAFVDYLETLDPATATWFAVGWESVLDGMLPLEVTVGQLPKRLSRSGRHFELDYRPVLTEGGELDRVVVVISDVTTALDCARAEIDERETTRLFGRLIADRPGFLEFLSEARSLVESIRTGLLASTSGLSRSLHTLKGNAALYGIESVAELCHELEDRLADKGRLTDADLAPLLARWGQVSAKVGALVGEERTKLEIEDCDYRDILAAVERGTSRARLREMLLAWRLEPTRLRLQRIAAQAEALATRLGKGPIAIDIESNDLRLAPERWSSFWAAAVHVVRNAVDHGLEGPEQRGPSKAAGGRLIFRTRLQGDTFSIEFSDNGRGIAWDAVKHKAAASGLPTRTPAELVQALFEDGLSTRDVVTEVSGRGIGLGAARRACQELGGRVEIESEEGKGTTIRFLWPAKSLSASVARPVTPSRPPTPADLERAS